MSSSQQPHQSAYTYTSSSAQSTRQILENDATSTQTSNSNKNISSNASGSTSNLPSRPYEMNRKSSNYADAAAAAAATTSASAGPRSGVAGQTTASSTDGSGSGGWKPSLDRNQSWNQEDWKRKVLMTGISDGDKGRAGFSQKS